ncbi:hypothetical protein SDC9_210125 [bioreactor metagenome]|uniref:Uncharacterized protein n=1 Tax=bioreactor metagenome TaxID=1076179 RepID=A0A645JF98_9ZZZZ
MERLLHIQDTVHDRLESPQHLRQEQQQARRQPKGVAGRDREKHAPGNIKNLHGDGKRDKQFFPSVKAFGKRIKKHDEE